MGTHEPTTEVFLDEVFLSLQGEARDVGTPQLFLRLAGCPLRCVYCDTPRSWTRRDSFLLHERESSRRLPNPVSAGQLSRLLERVAAGYGVAPESVTLSVTGGEPLEQVDFLEQWLSQWPGAVLLETAGVWPRKLERLMPFVDQLSLDWKIDSTVREGNEHLAASDCARVFCESGVDGWVKVVVTENTGDDELACALISLGQTAPGVRTYLQPTTHFGSGPAPPSADQLLQWALKYRRLPLDLRVQPQVHPLLGSR